MCSSDLDLAEGAAPAELQLARYVHAVVAFLADRHELTQLLLVAAPRDPVLRPMVQGLFDHVRGQMRAALADGQAAGLVRPLDAELTSHLLLGAVHGALVGGLGERTVDEVAREVQAYAMARLPQTEPALAMAGAPAGNSFRKDNGIIEID